MILFLAVTITKKSIFRSEVLFLARFGYLLGLATGSQRIPTAILFQKKWTMLKPLMSTTTFMNKQLYDSYSKPHF